LFAVEQTADLGDWTVVTNLANLGTSPRTLTVVMPVDRTERARYYRVRVH
jgi:hypothetical protein